MELKIYDVIVIGGGASGIMAAISAAQVGATVLLIEKNKRLGEKIRITGGGRCNILNAELNLRTLLSNYGEGEKFLYSAFSQYGVRDTIDFFENIKLPIKIEARNRAFPTSEKAADVIHVLQNQLDKYNVEIMTNSKVDKINKTDNVVESIIIGGNLYKAKNYVLATGGTSRPETGSTGDGFGWLEQLGHKVKMPTPNVTPLAIKEQWVSKISGAVVRAANITFFADSIKSFNVKGDVLFTHFGISGPVILNSSSKVAELLESSIVTAKIDCLTDMDEKQLDQKIASILNENGSKILKNVVQLFAPTGFAPALKEMLQGQVNFETKTSEVTKETRKTLVLTLKNLTVTIDHLMGFEKAVVADGGVNLKEIDTKTMRSKVIENLFITGDLLDINRPSGGYSLQLCWTTGYIAGINSVQ